MSAARQMQMQQARVVRPKPQMVPPVGWISLTAVERTFVYCRKEQLSSYGDAPVGFEGNAWVTLSGTSFRWYVLETMDEITALLQ